MFAVVRHLVIVLSVLFCVMFCEFWFKVTGGCELDLCLPWVKTVIEYFDAHILLWVSHCSSCMLQCCRHVAATIIRVLCCNCEVVCMCKFFRDVDCQRCVHSQVTKTLKHIAFSNISPFRQTHTTNLILNPAKTNNVYDMYIIIKKENYWYTRIWDREKVEDVLGKESYDREDVKNKAAHKEWKYCRFRMSEIVSSGCKTIIVRNWKFVWKHGKKVMYLMIKWWQFLFQCL